MAVSFFRVPLGAAMIAELVYLPTILLIGLGLLLLDSGSSSSDDSDETDGGTLGDGADGTDDMVDPLTSDPVAADKLTEDDDKFEGTDDDNTIFAGEGDDDVSGGAGDDRVFLNEGDDVSGPESGDMAGDDLIRGGDGSDSITDNLGANTIFGDLGADTIDTTDADDESTADLVHGGFGNDAIFADDGDTVTGGGGDDTFTVVVETGSEDPVTITDFEKGDRLIVEVLQTKDEAPDDASIVLAENETDTEIQLEGQTIAIIQGVADLEALNIQFVTRIVEDEDGIEIAANAASQTLTGTENADIISTGGGDDTVNTAGGDDVIDATGGGDNVINAGLGDDFVIAGDGDDLIKGSLGADNLNGGGGSDVIDGGFGADTLTANDAAGTNASDTLLGGAGADRLVGDDGDTMTGGEWRDTFVVETIEAGDAVVTVTDFNVAEDQLEIGADGTVTYVAANAGADTTVLVDGIAVFLLQGVTPAEMAGATVTNAAA